MTQKSCRHTQQMLNINMSSCSSLKMQSVISDMLFTERRSIFSESEGGNDWFSLAKKFSKFPLHYWLEMNNFENNVPLFLALFNWLSFFDLYFFLFFYLYLFIYLLIYLFIYFYESIYEFIYLFAYLFVCLFVYLFIYLFIFLFIFYLMLTNYN